MCKGKCEKADNKEEDKGCCHSGEDHDENCCHTEKDAKHEESCCKAEKEAKYEGKHQGCCCSKEH